MYHNCSAHLKRSFHEKSSSSKQEGILVVLYFTPLMYSGHGLSTIRPVLLRGQQVPISSVVALQYEPSDSKQNKIKRRLDSRRHTRISNTMNLDIHNLTMTTAYHQYSTVKMKCFRKKCPGKRPSNYS